MSKLIDTIAEAIQDKKRKKHHIAGSERFRRGCMSRFRYLQRRLDYAGRGHRPGNRRENAGRSGRKSMAHRRNHQQRMGRNGLRGRAGAHFPDRAARFLQTRTTLGRRSGDPLRIRSVRQYRNGPTVDFLDKSIT